MIDLRKEMPVLARHEGVWEGRYLLVDLEGKPLDSHASHLECSFPDSGEFPYMQVNTYTWDDGRREEIHFPAHYRDQRIWWDNDRIRGSAWELDSRSIVLTWTRKDLPGSYLYEMIQISDDNRRRARTWHWFVDDALLQRTLIREQRVK
ncbi:MAG: DUF3598 domain-containing protein [Deltaproteobacteria bacterium]|nr:DUF3598 domain-containing protein [Deltaproteobacteria bacterium]MDD9827138.1 DUF3598 domain-containing protein [Deltaproteobacteria bacterium]MDD9854262.1 DUF3598 domain-containing protein [Deltaproteobacteria bacterium]MDD9873569.1 DUF3598 domain-containing protein [Deltaproteobacteria bacterium]